MSVRFPSTPTIQLPATRFEAPLQVDLQAFLDFSFSFAEALLDLETRFTTHRPGALPAKVSH